MLRILDRYLLREIFPPFLVANVILTFALLMNQIILLSQRIVEAQGSLGELWELLFHMIPSVLVFTLPMALFIGILAGLGRMWTDSEINVMKALKISSLKIFGSIFLFSFAVFALDSILALHLAPRSNFRYNQILAESMSSKPENLIRSQRFITSFPEMVLFISGIPPNHDWERVFIHIFRSGLDPVEIFARKGGIRIYPDEDSVLLELSQGLTYSHSRDNARHYSVTSFQRLEEDLNLSPIDSRERLHKNLSEKNILELFETLEDIKAERRTGLPKELKPEISTYQEWEQLSLFIEIHKRFALPCSCLFFFILAVFLGTARNWGGRTGGFALGILIIVFYYILMTAGESLAREGHISSLVGTWCPNLSLGLMVVLLWMGSKSRILFFKPGKVSKSGNGGSRRRNTLINSQGNFTLRTMRPAGILDGYVFRRYLIIFCFAFFAVITLSLAIEFFEKIGRVYQFDRTFPDLLRFLSARVPWHIQQVLPLSALIAAIFALGIMSKTNESTGIKSCGISLYRISAVPLLSALFLCGGSFMIQEHILPRSNSKADSVWADITRRMPFSSGPMDSQWIMGKGQNRIYFYRYFNPANLSFSHLTIFDIDWDKWELERHIFAEKAAFQGNQILLTGGTLRNFRHHELISYEETDDLILPVEEEVRHFLKERKEPEMMSIAVLNEYIKKIEAIGIESSSLRTDLFAKTAFPFSPLILTLLGIPFAFSLGKRGALGGVGISLLISMLYWGSIGIFKSLGYAGYLSPWISAWGPNAVFAVFGIYLFLKIRT